MDVYNNMTHLLICYQYHSLLASHTLFSLHMKSYTKTWESVLLLVNNKGADQPARISDPRLDHWAPQWAVYWLFCAFGGLITTSPQPLSLKQLQQITEKTTTKKIKQGFSYDEDTWQRFTDCIIHVLKQRQKSYAHQRETTGSSSDYLPLRPFSNLQHLLKERGSEFFPLRTVP